VDKVQIDIKDHRRGAILADNMLIPYFFKERCWFWVGHFIWDRELIRRKVPAARRCHLVKIWIELPINTVLYIIFGIHITAIQRGEF